MQPNKRKNLDYIPIATAQDRAWAVSLKGQTPKKLRKAFVEALDHGHVWRVAFLLEMKVEKKHWFKENQMVNLIDLLDGYNAELFLAIDNNDINMARLLLDYGAKPNVGSECKPLDRAIHASTPRMIEMLLDYGADVRLASFSILDNVVKEQPAESLELLLKAGTRRHILDPSIISYCMWHDMSQKFELLLKYGGDANANKGALVIDAVKSGSLKHLELLIKHGAKVNHRKNLALFTAIKRKDHGMVELLIKHGANTDDRHDAIVNFIKKNKMANMAKILHLDCLVSQNPAQAEFMKDTIGADVRWEKKSDFVIEKTQRLSSKGLTLTQEFNFKSKEVYVSVSADGMPAVPAFVEKFDKVANPRDVTEACRELKKRGGRPHKKR